MSVEDFSLLLSKVDEDDPFRDLLLFAWHSGCRPQEARHIEPRHVHLADACIVIPKEEAKGKRHPRIIHSHGPALDIVRRLFAQRSDGKLFRNVRGNPWKNLAICNRFDHLNLAIGMDVLEVKGIPDPPLPRFDRRRYKSKAEIQAARN